MKSLPVCTVWLFTCLIASAQSGLHRDVVAAQGGSDRTATIQLDWTLGEAAVQSLETPSGMLTEGFHQPLLSIHKLDEPLPALPATTNATPALSVRIFPNPTAGSLHILPEGNDFTTLNLVLYSAGGDLLQKRSIDRAGEIDLSPLPSGFYDLGLYTDDGSYRAFYRVIKQ
jgi:hypothetical protein